MKKLRYYFLILNYLSIEPCSSKEQIMSHLQQYGIVISERTLYRAISELNDEFGVEVKLDHQKKGYFITPACLKSAHLVVGHLKNLITADLLGQNLTNKNEFHRSVEFDTKGGAFSICLLQQILQSIVKKRSIFFTLTNQQGQSQAIELAPVLLKQHHNRWYVIGAIIDEIEDQTLKEEHLVSFDICNISDLSCSLTKHNLFKKSMQSVFKEIVGVDYTPSTVQKIVLEIQECYKDFLDRNPLHSSQNIKKSKEKNKWILTLQVRPNEALQSEILKYSPKVRVMEPLWFKEALVEKLQQAIALHS